MKRFYSILILLFTISSFQTAFAEANYVYHEASTNNIGCGTNFRSVLTPTSAQALTVGFKIEFQNYWNQARIYYTTDGSTPSGSFGTGSGTTLVVTANYVCGFGSPVAETVTGVIPAQPAGTVVKYIVSAWHSGGGDEIFANGPGAPCSGCGTVTNSSSLATVFNYTVTAAANVDVYATGGTAYAGYTTVKGAIDAINAGTHTGVIRVVVNTNTSETATSVLHSSGAGSASYTSINLRPSADAITVSGASATGRGLIELNGADNVTIDGDNPNTAGTNRNLTITNTATATVAYCSVIRLATNTNVLNSDNVTIKNCVLNGNATGRNASGITSTTGSENTSFVIYAGGNGGTTSTTAPTALASVTTNTSASGQTFANLVISNNVINQAARAVVLNGAATTVFNAPSITNNTLGATSGTTTIYTKGIYVQGATSLVITGNTIQSVQSYVGTLITGIELYGLVATTANISNNIINNVLQNNSGNTNQVWGIGVGSNAQIAAVTTISGNTVTSVKGFSNSSAGAPIVGIVCNSPSAIIEKNIVSTIYNNNTSTYGAHGISLFAGNNMVVRNNFVRDVTHIMSGGLAFSYSLAPVGILAYAGTGHKIYHNSVSLSGLMPGTSTSSLSSYAFAVATTSSTGLDVRNNIFSNTITGGTTSIAHCSMFLPSGATSTMNLTLNNNAYYSGSDTARQGILQVGTTAGTGFYLASNFSSSVITPAANSRSYTSTLSSGGANDNAAYAYTTAAPFISATNLHIPAGTVGELESTGASLGVTTDIDNETRPGPTGSVNGGAYAPDLGADEFDGVPVAPIVITPAAPAGVCSGTPVTLVASSATAYTYTWSPATGLNTTTGATVIATPSVTTTYTVTGVFSGFTKTKTVTVTINPSPTAVVIANADAPICADAIQTLTATGGLVPLTIFSESFASGLGTFTATNSSTSGTPANAAWTNRANGYVYSTDTFNSNDASNFVLSNSDSQGSGGTTATTLITPVFSLVNITSPTLKFYHYYRNSGDTATVQISTDGGTTFPTTLATYTSTQGTASAFALVSLDLSAYAGMSNLKIRFKYDAAWDWYWAIDNVSVTGSTSQIVWSSSPASPNSMFTDAACTTAYNGTDFRTTLYVKPSTTTTYTATATLGTCTATDTVTLTVGTTTWAIVSPATTPSWDNGAPTSTVAAVISADYTTGGTSLDACSLTVNNNAVVVISSGDDVTLSSGSLTVATGSTYTQQNNANLIQTNADAVNSGGTIIERNSSAVNRLDYTMWCAPVSGTQTLQNFSQYTLSTRFYEYNTATDLYNSISNAGTWSMAKGYLIRVNNTWPVFPAAAVVWPGKFRGTPNNGTKTFTLSTAGNGFNAVGNPYPSALKVDDFINANSTQIDGTLWFWRKTNDTTNLTSYSTCTTAGCTLNNGHSYANADYLSVGQGFLVKAKAGATAVTFDNTMRASTNVDQFFKANNTVDRYWVSLNTSTGASFQNLYAYLPDATLNYDNGKDGIFYNDTTLASLSSVVNGVEMVIQARPSFVPTDIIPLMFKTTEAGTYSISLYQTEGVFADAQDILVKDNLLGTTQSIKLGAYTFTSDVGVFANRFELVYQPALSVNTANFDASVQVIKQNDDIVINAGNTIISKVKVFDTRGRLLIDKKNINASEVRLASDKTQQVLLVQITSNEGKVVTKKIVN